MQEIKGSVRHGGEKSKVGVGGVKPSSAVTSGVGGDKHSSVAGDVCRIGGSHSSNSSSSASDSYSNSGSSASDSDSSHSVRIGGVEREDRSRQIDCRIGRSSIVFSCPHRRTVQLSLQDKRCILSANFIAAGHVTSSKSVCMQEERVVFWTIL